MKPKYLRSAIADEKELRMLGPGADGQYIKDHRGVIAVSNIKLLPLAAQSLSEASQYIYDKKGEVLRFHYGYRSVSQQYCIFKRALLKCKNFEDVIKRVAPAYYSEHHTGLAVDIQNIYDVANEVLPFWGWELSYPLKYATGILHKPWHFRFVGRTAIDVALAREYVDQDLAAIGDENKLSFANVDNSDYFSSRFSSSSEILDWSLFHYLVVGKNISDYHCGDQSCLDYYLGFVNKNGISGITSCEQLFLTLEYLLTLIPGEKSREVMNLQALLAKLGLFKVNPTGFFGSITKASVKDANKLFNLPAVEVALPNLRARLSQCLVLPLEAFTPEQLAISMDGEWKTKISEGLKFFQLQDSRSLFQPARNDLIIMVGKEGKITSQLQRFYRDGKHETIIVGKNQQLEEAFKFNILEVDDSVRAACRLAKLIRGEQSSKLIAVTGSSGKTTLVRMLGDVISTQRRVVGNSGWNSLLGNVCAVANNPEAAEVIITECGLGAGWSPLATMSPIIQPDVVVVTSITSAHIAGYKNISGLTSAKLQLANHMKAGGVLIVDGDSSQLSQFLNYAKEKCIDKVVTVGEAASNDFRIRDYSCDSVSSCFRIECSADCWDVVIPLLGRHKVKLAGYVLACAYLLELNIAEVIKGLNRVKIVPGRGNVIGNPGNGLAIFDSHYNANPGSMMADLEAYASVCKKVCAPRVAVIGAMKELGEGAEDYHLSLLPIIREAGFDHIFFVGEEARVLYEKTSEFTSVSFHDESVEVTEILNVHIKGDEFIFVKGSNANNLKCVVDRLARHICD